MKPNKLLLARLLVKQQYPIGTAINALVLADANMGTHPKQSIIHLKNAINQVQSALDGLTRWDYLNVTSLFVNPFLKKHDRDTIFGSVHNQTIKNAVHVLSGITRVGHFDKPFLNRLVADLYTTIDLIQAQQGKS